MRAAPRNSWLTFLPDTGIITGAPLTVAEAAKIADRVGASTTPVRIVVEDRTSARILREKGLLGDPHDEVAGGAGALHMDERNAARFIDSYDARSHGESFLELFESRIRPRGLYLMDEPEAPLSPMRQLEALRLIVRAAGGGAQFIIATHSPIFLACPGARIFSFDEPPIREASFAELEHVNVMRDFLNDPSGHLERLLEEDE